MAFASSDAGQGSIPLWVNRVILAVGRLLPVFR